MVYRRIALFAVAIAVLSAGAFPTESGALSLGTALPNSLTSDAEFQRTYPACPWIGVKKFCNSFTSYQFPNPFPPGQDPLSRLEFPIDQWFLGVGTGYGIGSVVVKFEGWTNANREASLRMQDSDWENEADPGNKSIFSESGCRLNRAWLLDLQFALASPQPLGPVDVRPAVGLRYQRFSFTTRDGVQFSTAGETLELPGDGIDFDQSFYHLYLGGIFHTVVDLGRFTPRLPSLRIDIQLDYAPVLARNEDLHLLRGGERITVENTRGHCWHASAGSELCFLGQVKTRLDVDFKRIITHGGHQLTNNAFLINFSFDGSRVWSDQFSIMASGELSF